MTRRVTKVNIPTRLPVGRAATADAASYVAERYRRRSISPLRLALLAAGADLFAFTQAYWFGFYVNTNAATFDPVSALVTSVIFAVIAVAALLSISAYAPRWLARARRSIPLALTIGLAPILIQVIATAPGATDSATARLAVLAVLIIPIRWIMAALTRWAWESGLFERRAVIAGGGQTGERLIRELAVSHAGDIRACAIFDDREDERSPSQILGIPKLGRFTALPEFCQQAEIDLIIISLPLTAKERLAHLLKEFRVLPVPVQLAALNDRFGYAASRPGQDFLITALPPSFVPRRRLTKRLFDLIFATLALVVCWPIMALAALAVWIDSPGPILFRQKRHGFNNRAITVLKFRTIRQEMCDPTAEKIVTRDDPRVTRIGRFLRRSSIDELPQLFNVLAGDLSMVGPRPHALRALTSQAEPFEEIVESYSARHRLPPGITGLAQINGWRGEIDKPDKLRRRIEDDLFYIENWSLWLDLKILLQTPISLVRSNNAY